MNIGIREIKATLLSPCCLSDKPAIGNEVDTLDYIPGSKLMGIMAGEYLKNGEKPDGDFRKIFCQDIICFPNLNPFYEGTLISVRPIPLSIYTCKSRPGFRGDGDIGKYHGVRDLLFENSSDRRCIKCNAPLIPYTGFYDGDYANPKSYNGLNSILFARTAVNYGKQSALDASFHSQRELPAGTEFKGLLTSSDEDMVKKLLSGLKTSKIVSYTGRRAMGKIEIVIETSSLKPPVDALIHFPLITLTLLSDAIILDKFLRPVITLTPEILKDRQIGFPDVPASIEKAFCATRRVSGWHSVAKIFKPDDIALVKGSTFLIKVLAEDAKEPVRNWMESIIYTGIGLRRSEGFGQVCFDEPIHEKAFNGGGKAL